MQHASEDKQRVTLSMDEIVRLSREKSLPQREKRHKSRSGRRWSSSPSSVKGHGPSNNENDPKKRKSPPKPLMINRSAVSLEPPLKRARSPLARPPTPPVVIDRQRLGAITPPQPSPAASMSPLGTEPMRTINVVGKRSVTPTSSSEPDAKRLKPIKDEMEAEYEGFDKKKMKRRVGDEEIEVAYAVKIPTPKSTKRIKLNRKPLP